MKQGRGLRSRGAWLEVQLSAERRRKCTSMTDVNACTNITCDGYMGTMPIRYALFFRDAGGHVLYCSCACACLACTGPGPHMLKQLQRPHPMTLARAQAVEL